MTAIRTRRLEESATKQQAARLQRARDIITARDLWGMLQYMEDCPVGYRDDGGDPNAMRRYLVITSTDGGEDGWVDLKETVAEVEELVRGLLTDEWGLVGAWDLDYQTCEPLLVKFDLQVVYPQRGASHG